MTPLALDVALAHLRGRKRQTAVSVLGVMLGVSIYIAISGMMQGFHTCFLRQLVETNPHVLITDEVRIPGPQPLQMLHSDAAVEVTRVLPRDPVRGISAAGGIIAALDEMPGVAAAPMLSGQLILRRNGRDYAVNALGIEPARQARVTSIAQEMVAGSLPALAREPNGIVIGRSLAEKMGVAPGDIVAAVAAGGRESSLRVVGLYHSGLEEQDLTRVYLNLVRQQSLQGRPRVVNQIGIRLADIGRSIPFAARIEGRFGYKTAPWEETYSRFLDVLALQNWIIYSTLGAILVVAGFGIFNIISTVVLEKARDIAIMRSIGVASRQVVCIFVLEGGVVGVLGMVAGWGMGRLASLALARIPAPGAADPTQTLMIAQTWWIYGSASVLALIAAVGAAWLPARRAARIDPLAVIRGAT
jgi:lipoprotein-releasing system permease protein